MHRKVIILIILNNNDNNVHNYNNNNDNLNGNDNDNDNLNDNDNDNQPVHTRQNKVHVRLLPMENKPKSKFKTGLTKASQKQLLGLQWSFRPPREDGK